MINTQQSCLSMFSFEDMANYMIQLQQNPSILRKSYIQSNRVHVFLKDWFCNQNSTKKQGEYEYVWPLVYGWEMNQIGQSFMTSAQMQKEYLKNRAAIDSQIVVLQPTDRDFFRYSNKNEAIISMQNNLFWINPTYEYYQKSKKVIDNYSFNLIIILTSSKIKTLISFLKIKSKSPQLRLITIQQIYIKLKQLISFLRSSFPDSQQFSVKNYPTYFLSPQEYFQYANLIWLVRQNCWYQPSFDLVITVKHTKQSFLIEQPKLSESLVYYGWKKKIITDDNYQRYIREWDKSIIKPMTAFFPTSYKLCPFDNPFKKEKHHWYLDFIGKQLFMTLGNKDLQQLFSCCQVIEVIANQVVCKLGYLFDFLYVILEGQYQYCEKNSDKFSVAADKHRLFGLKDLRNRQNTYSYTLRSVTKGTLLRIDKNNLYFHLYDLLQ